MDGETYALERPFMVVATQNPIEHEGTYPLPEAELDRFLMRVRIGYPDPEAEVDVLSVHGLPGRLDEVEPVISAANVRKLIELAQTRPRRRRDQGVHRRAADRHARARSGVPRRLAARRTDAAARGARDGRRRRHATTSSRTT